MALVTTGVKKKPVLKSKVLSNKLIGGGGVKLGGPTAAKAPAPATSPKPAAPAVDPVPPVVAPPPVVLGSSTADRFTGREQFGTGLATGNRGLKTLAQALGGLSNISQYNWDPGADPRGFGNITASNLAVDPNDPNSTMATIGRNLGKNLQFVGDTNQNRNTWTGGLRLTEEDEQRTNANNARTKATQDYESARLDLVDQLTGGFNVYKGVVRGANAADDAATAAAINNAPAQAAPPPPAAAKPAPTGASIAAASAAAHGGPAKVTNAVVGNYWGEWHTYPDGHRVFVKKMPWSSVG